MSLILYFAYTGWTYYDTTTLCDKCQDFYAYFWLY